MFSRRCCPGLYVSEQQAWHGFKALFLFAVILGLIRARFVTKKWIPAFTFPSSEKRARVSLMAHARCFSVNSQQTAVIKQLMEAFHSFLFFFSLFTRPQGCCTVCTAARPSQGEAFNCFFAGGSSWQCLTSLFPGEKRKKKQREILETAAKRISAYAWSPLWSLSNKRISFNLVTTGAFHRTRFAEMFSQEKPACMPPPPGVPDELSDLWKFMYISSTPSTSLS